MMLSLSLLLLLLLVLVSPVLTLFLLLLRLSLLVSPVVHPFVVQFLEFSDVLVSEHLLLLLVLVLLLLLLLLSVFFEVPISEHLFLLLPAPLLLLLMLLGLFQIGSLLSLCVLHDQSQEQGSPGSVQPWLWDDPHWGVKVSCGSVSCSFLGLLLARSSLVLSPLGHQKLARLWSSCSLASWVLLCPCCFASKKSR